MIEKIAPRLKDGDVVVSFAAARQIQGLPEAQRQGVQLVQIDLDRRPDLGEKIEIVRAPAILLIDAEGFPVYRQDEFVTDLEPLNLLALQQKLQEMMGAEFMVQVPPRTSPVGRSTAGGDDRWA